MSLIFQLTYLVHFQKVEFLLCFSGNIGDWDQVVICVNMYA